MQSSSTNELPRADPRTIHNKVLLGYQGWFTCPGDGEPVGPGHHGWLHWMGHPIPDGGNINIDFWPDMSTYTDEEPSERFEAPGLKRRDEYGQEHPVYLFSSRHPRTVQRHFHWMAENGVDGVFLQRFVGQCDMQRDNEGIRRIRDEVGDLVKAASEAEGRVFAIMYDLAGVGSDRTQRIIESDWQHLLRAKRILESPNYLRENGKPVIAIWGFGFEYQDEAPAVMKAVTDFIRKVTPGGAYIMAGVPAPWYTDPPGKHAELPPAFMQCFDAICPWTVGVYHDQESIDWYFKNRMKPDLDYVRKWEKDTGKHVDYIPTVHPGSSGCNTSQGHWTLNAAPRRGGKYLWRQFYNAIFELGVHTVYGAMCDEYDEGTNFLPTVTSEDQLPGHHKFKFIVPDADRPEIPSDWYMRIAGYAAEALKGKYKIGEGLPERDLWDWYRSHPRAPIQFSRAASGPSSGQWPGGLENSKDDLADAPPPYTLEAELNTVPVETARPAVPAATRPEPPPAPAETRPRPPVAPTTTRPQAPPLPQSTRPDARPNSVHALADDFRRQSMTRPEHRPPSISPRPTPPPQQGRASSSPQWPPADWNASSSHMPAPSRPASSYAPPPPGPGYRPGYVTHSSESMSSYPGMQQEHSSSYPGMQCESSSFYMAPNSPTTHSSYMPPSPTSVSYLDIPPSSPLSVSTTPGPPPPGPPPPRSPPFGPPPGPPRFSGPSMPVPEDSGFVGGFTGYEPVYPPPPGPPPGHPHGAPPPPPPRPPPRPASAHPPSQGGSYYASPPQRASSVRHSSSVVQGYAQNAFGYASGVVGRVAGEDSRRKIEQAGSKLFSKFK